MGFVFNFVLLESDEDALMLLQCRECGWCFWTPRRDIVGGVTKAHNDLKHQPAKPLLKAAIKIHTGEK